MSELDLLLSVPTLLEMVEQFPSFTDPLPFTKLFKSGDEQDLDGDTVIYEKVTNDRRLAAVRGHSSEPYEATEPTSTVVKEGVIYAQEKETITAERLFLRAGKGTFLRSNARQVIIKAIGRITSRLLRTREYVCSALLQLTGGVQLTPSNTAFVANAVTVVNTVNIQGGLQNVAAGQAWDIASAKMMSGANQLLAMKRTMEGNGFRPYYFLMTQLLEAAVIGNLEAQQWFTANGITTIEAIRRSLETGPRVQGSNSANRDDAFEPNAFSGIGGVRSWHTWDHHYTNRTGAVTRYLTDGNGIMLPKELDEVLGFAEGLTFLPSEDGPIVGDPAQAEDLFNLTNGIGLYAYRPEGTTSIVVVGVDSFLPFVKNENGALLVTGLTS